MSTGMSLSVNGQSQVPPGFRFHPTEDELLSYYLRKKVALDKIDLDVIRDVDLNKLEPWDIQEICKIGSTRQNEWYFFSQKDRKYPTGTRTNRATAAGFWKATGRDKAIYSHGARIGMRKTLVFYRGRAPHGRKSEWIMHEYRLDEDNIIHDNETGPEEGWVVCRAFKKKNYLHKASSAPELAASENDVKAANNILDQMLAFAGPAFAHLPQLGIVPLDNPTDNPFSSFKSSCDDTVEPPRAEVMDWAVLDRLVASQLNGNPNTEPLCGFELENINGEDHFPLCPSSGDNQLFDVQNSDGSNPPMASSSSHVSDFWSFGGSSSSTLSLSSSDPLSHFSV